MSVQVVECATEWLLPQMNITEYYYYYQKNQFAF